MVTAIREPVANSALDQIILVTDAAPGAVEPGTAGKVIQAVAPGDLLDEIDLLEQIPAERGNPDHHVHCIPIAFSGIAHGLDLEAKGL